jgi:uncharacterized protein
MYKLASNVHVYSPSDLVLYMRSPFASWMERLNVDKPEQLVDVQKDVDLMMDLLASKGNLHEAQYLELMRVKYGANNVAVIERDSNTAAAKTLEAMEAGFDVIFQAYLQRDNFKGYADFLVKCEGPSALGDYHYEVWDTKLSKSIKPYFIVQLCCYSWMLEPMQGRLADEVAVVLGDKDKTSERFRIAGYFSYFLNLKQRFLSAQDGFSSDRDSMPDPTLCNDYGAWGGFAKQIIDESDSLALVANIRKSQIKKLMGSGVKTLSELAHSDLTYIKGIATETLCNLKAQAGIQLTSRGKDKPDFKVIETDQGKGLSVLPPHSRLDVFFDIEGHPLVDGGLEYLWGVSYRDTQAVQGKSYAFKDWWAHDQAQEKLAFEGFIDWSYQRWQEDPSMHIYHYALYEITAINKISTRYQTRLDKVVELLKNAVFVDLYKIVKNGLLVGEPKYSIKNIEHLYRSKRMTEVANGGDSIVFYENWREAGGAENWLNDSNGYKHWLEDADHFDWNVWKDLKEIRDYNIDDCESTLELVDWLRAQQSEMNIPFNIDVDSQLVEIEKSDKQIENEEKRRVLMARQQKLIDAFDSDETLKQDPQAQLLISLVHFYDRERKPKIWTYFERLAKSDEELLEDDTVVHDVIVTSTHLDSGKLHCKASYSIDQPIRTDKFKNATIKDSTVKVSKITFNDLDEHRGEIEFFISQDNEEVLRQSPLTLLGDEPYISPENLENRLCEVVEQYFETRELPKGLDTIVKRSNPRFLMDEQRLPVTRTLYPDNQEYLDAIIEVVHRMDESCLCIQGPPGSGKTYTAKHVIKDLVAQGKRIGIMSNSHEAIMNLLKELVEELPNTAIAKIGGYGTQTKFQEMFNLGNYSECHYRPSMVFTKTNPYPSFQIVGATVYGFANDLAYEDPMDYLFVDEASQVSLANLVAVSGAAKNVILMGDQMQLEQPIQGSHPGDAGSTALDFMLQGHAVIPEAKGIFLERTFRMHPAVCMPLSEVIYEGKLEADEKNKEQAVIVQTPKFITKQNGILTVNVDHEGNTQSSEEEVQIVLQLVDELKTGRFIDKDQNSKPITDSDILIMAPYNMQVNLLKEKLIGDLKIGTIDKFQGQEAPVVIISMAVSDVDDSPRGLDFIFNKNRLNVAISRAKALAIVVSNKGLENCSVNSLGQMEKVGLFCKLTSDLDS